MGSAATAPSTKTGPGKHLRILIADSHEVMRRGIRTIVEDRSEWQICGEAATGAEAIAKTKALCPDLLMLDLSLPDMEPAKAVPRLVEVCPTIKIVGMAMQDSAESAANALAAGANGLVLKSDAASDLALAVQNVGRGQPFLSPAAVILIRSQLGRSRTWETTPDDLTPREVEVLKALAKGQSNKQAAEALAISVKTVHAHRANLMRKLKLASYSNLVRFAIRHGVIKTSEP